ncbi:DNA polymerase/3'-5' exonuclease PolX [Immundisolibacter sp.]|uniref:DNA polymerase/3'-5' exonuclease PolX n=1 Tax=Immundisolibacter sp. TaxID=1934948 RepID=UPI00263270DC|nr:DNA polymerase/3'-5' exonuclease PolX [Immundisolibacter sp.]MDD3650051.1 DNA polymerase/3'-5' exonuclease PolX [Immundisolibacter sp.]
MPIHNADIAAIFEQVADLLEIEGANPFRVRAYRNAARTVGEFGQELAALVAAGQELPHLPGIGDDLAGKIREIATTGRLTLLERLRGELPPALTELLEVPGLGPKRVKALHEALGVDTVEQLRAAAEAGRIREVPGFGPKTEQRILEHLRGPGEPERRLLLAVARQYAEALAAHLRATPGVQQVEVAGSYRRRKETVGDLDILVTAADAAPVMGRFTAYDEVREVLSQGPTRASVVLASGLQVDLRVVEPASFGAALHYFTGSKAHNIAIRKRGQARGLKINEYGVFRGKDRIAGETEQSVFAAVDLPWIPPELREDRGEIEWAARAPLPRLIERADLRGDLHCHSRASDGHATLQELAAAARAAGLEYLAITEHSQRLTVARGLGTERLLKQCEEIDALNARLDGIVLLKGIEVDILEDGRLDLPDDVLSQLDLVIGAVHSHFDLPPARQLKRLLRAIDHPHFTLLAHPGCREINKRPLLDIDWLRLVRHARQRGCFLELNAQPKRLDLTDVHARMAKEEGVLVAINSDAHAVHDLDDLDYGIGQARRGWLTAEDVLNTRPLPELRKLLGNG